MLVTALAKLVIPRIDTAADIYVPIVYSILVIVGAVAVYMEKRWGYWASLVLAGLQLFAMCYVAILASENFMQIGIDVLFQNTAVLVSIVSASILLFRKQTEQVGVHQPATR
jgi:NO-binding membrane sensor protein with MHYT domain